MTRYFVRASGGSDSNDGLTYATAFATPNHFEAIPPVAGDELRCAPGIYRLSASAAASGGNAYSTGTVSVTNGSAVVTGSGTSWLANAFAAQGMFKVSQIAHGTDGVANGTTTFTSTTGNFQSNMVGLVIRIGTKSPFTISAVGSATSITLSGSPASGSGLTYDVGGEPALEILSVDSNTQITLKEAWAGPTLTGLAYTTWRDIRYVGDEDGQLTDGVGGRVRFTGSDDDQSATRSFVIANAQSYRTYRGLYLGESTAGIVTLTGDHTVIEQCVLQRGTNGINNSGASALHNTIRKCYFALLNGTGMQFTHTVTVDNCGNNVENCIFEACITAGLGITRYGGVFARNITARGNVRGAQVATAAATGQNALSLYNSLIFANTTGIVATATTDVFEDYNGVDINATARTNTNTGTNSKTFMPLMATPLLSLGVHIPIFGTLDSASLYGSRAGFLPATTDFYGITRAATSSWGAVEYSATRRPSDSGRSRGAA